MTGHNIFTSLSYLSTHGLRCFSVVACDVTAMPSLFHHPRAWPAWLIQ
jgi:hypothetical protein